MADHHPPLPHAIALDALAAVIDGLPVDFDAARSSIVWWLDNLDARAADPTTPEPFATAAARSAVRVRRLLPALDVIEAGDLDDARDHLRDALVGPIPDSPR